MRPAMGIRPAPSSRTTAGRGDLKIVPGRAVMLAASAVSTETVN